MSLQDSWAVTRFHLEKACALLSLSLPVHTENGCLDIYQEWLSHNELEMALDELEALGHLNSCSSEFWEELRIAAENMNLTEHAERYKTKLR